MIPGETHFISRLSGRVRGQNWQKPADGNGQQGRWTWAQAQTQTRESSTLGSFVPEANKRATQNKHRTSLLNLVVFGKQQRQVRRGAWNPSLPTYPRLVGSEGRVCSSPRNRVGTQWHCSGLFYYLCARDLCLPGEGFPL